MPRHIIENLQPNPANTPDYQPRHAAPEPEPAGSDLPPRGAGVQYDTVEQPRIRS